ncbi:hypothetical protein [Lonsdalea iberica]|uniref:Uncharacterized protein n=1 Tax=Lonsdalea iberica TaxID=1082703 RepID=A0A1X3RT48_9GAMM|nr:hypothetical protein [Lonsdalea iberica]OSN05036.1 hypothetical protein AU511_11105 [Lonsdalea iberica]
MALGNRRARLRTYPTYTLADIVLGLSTRRWYLTYFPYPERSAIARLYQTLCQGPGFEFDGDNGAP